MVNFRLTDSEYESIVFACHAEGVRTVSEFARDIVLSRARGETVQRGQVSQWLLGLTSDFAKLKADVSHVLGILEAEAGRAAAPLRQDFRTEPHFLENSEK